MELDSDTAWQSGLYDEAHRFASSCATFRDTNPSDRPALREVMVTLATELWDRSFSQSEIRSAFEAALADLPRYAAGEERRGDRERQQNSS